MSFADEWARIKQEVSGGPVMTLAHADGSGGTGGDGDLASDQAAWNAAAQGVGTLAGNLAKAGTTLYTAQEGMDTSLQASDSSFQTLAAQGELHAAWSGYLTGLQDKCAALERQLTAAGTALCISDEGARALFGQVDALFKDTPAVGGQS
jgi:hypothetical protein